MRKNEQMRSPRSNRANQSNGGSANGLLGLPGGPFDGFKADSFFGGSPFDSAKMLDSKNLPLSSLLMGAADARNATDPASYFHANGVPPNLISQMSLNSLLSMAALPNYFANPELLNLFLRQFEPKAFKELPDQIFNNCNGLVNGDEMLKNKSLSDNHEQSLRKLFQQLAGSPPAPVAPLPKNGQQNEQLNSPSLQNDQNNSNNNSKMNNLSTSFLNLSKMSDSDSSSTMGKKDHTEPGALVNGNGSKLPSSKKSTETPVVAKKDEMSTASEVKGTTTTSATVETNGKQFSGSNQHNHNMKMESEDEESQRDSSSLDDEMLMSDGKKVRVRSVLSEETLRVLRAQYAVNPRPKKQEILRLSEQVSYSPRVVQVWFQNMRFVHPFLYLFAKRVN